MRQVIDWAARVCELARHRRVLNSMARRYVASRHYGDELTPAATRQLRRLDRDGFVLALRIFAYDARTTTAAIVELSRRGERNEALSEKAALTARSLSGWALETAGFALPHDSLFELAAPLKIGLGPELKRWLVEPKSWVSEADAWLREYGSHIERFESKAARG